MTEAGQIKAVVFSNEGRFNTHLRILYGSRGGWELFFKNIGRMENDTKSSEASKSSNQTSAVVRQNNRQNGNLQRLESWCERNCPDINNLSSPPQNLRTLQKRDLMLAILRIGLPLVKAPQPFWMAILACWEIKLYSLRANALHLVQSGNLIQKPPKSLPHPWEC